MNYWIMKTEPDTFGLAHLKKRPKQTEPWNGVRNYQARNFLRAMKRGDQAFFYHSSCAKPGIVAIVEIVREAYPDSTAFDKRSPYYDPKSKSEKPIWYVVDVHLLRPLRRTILLTEIKRDPHLEGMRLVQRGNRLSVMPVSTKEWNTILELEDR